MKPILWLLCCGLLYGGMGIPAASGQEELKALAGQTRAVLKQHCQRCHSGPGSESGYEFDVLKDATLKAKLGEEAPVVVPGKPAESPLFVRSGIRKTMPPRYVKERPSEAELALVKKWIEAGAPPFPQGEGRKFRSLTATLIIIRDHLRSLPRPQDRQQQRYFTLANLHNNPAIPDADLGVYRAALSKALNSLSWKSRIVEPKQLDKEGTLFVVDVRQLDWDRHNLWNEVLRAYPYGLTYGTHANSELRQLDQEIAQMTGCVLPLVRADWFIATATRPPLYHTLLFDEYLPALRARPTDAQAAKSGNPKKMTAHDLEEHLKMDVALNFREDKLARAGFAKSGVSGQNRLVERHEPDQSSYYWKSYDFKPDNGRGRLTRFPLGPLALFPKGRHPFAGQAFAHDGGEIIFSLPNKLQGYLLVNAKDERIDEGPIQVVSDGLKTSGTPAIVNGVSCMACHKHGMIGFNDTVRDGSAVFGQAEEKVKLLFPDKAAMAQLVDADQRRFLDGLDSAVGRFLRVGADKRKPLQEFTEPVGEIARLYRLGYLDLRTAACELDLEKEEDLVKKVGEKRFKQLGLDGLLQPGGLIGRLEWEAVDGISLMQEVARELRATPVGP